MSILANRTHFALAIMLASLCLPLAGCSTYHSASSNGFSSARLSNAGGKDGLPFQVDGKVGDVQGAALASAVGSAMPASVGGTALHYTACEAYTECAGDHLVWTFGPPASRPRSAYPPELAVNYNIIGGYEPSATNVTAKVALIQGGNIVASVSGQVDAAGPTDPAFQSMIEQMSQSVLSGPDLFDWIGFP
jgi:hypothetical protein